MAGIPGLIALFQKAKVAFDAYAKTGAADKAMAGAEVGDRFTAPLPLDLEMRFRTKGGKRFRVLSIDAESDSFEAVRLPDKGKG